MIKKVTITDAQRSALDTAVIRAIRAGACRSAHIVSFAEVICEIAKLPLGKSDMRYVDDSLQRLRKDGKITASSNQWSVTAKGKNPKRGEGVGAMGKDELKVCRKCGWNDLQYAGHSCDPDAGATADALMAAVPEAESSKLGYGTGHVVLGYRLDDRDFVLKFQAGSSTLQWRDISCFMHDLTVEQAADLVRTLLAWRSRL